jgi:hypothetical protein
LNRKKVQRLWREEGLRVLVRHRRKRVGTSTSPAPAADRPNKIWAADFQWDSDENGRKIKIPHLAGEHTRERVGGLAERRMPAGRLTGLPGWAAATRGYPAAIRCDNGPEFASNTLAAWA